MKLTISYKGQDLHLRYSIRMYLLYESMSQGETFAGGSLMSIVKLLACALIASNPDVDITLEGVLDAIDDDPNILYRWRQWLDHHVDRQNQLAGIDSEVQDETGGDEQKKRPCHIDSSTNY